MIIRFAGTIFSAPTGGLVMVEAMIVVDVYE